LQIIDRRSFCEKGDARHIAVALSPAARTAKHHLAQFLRTSGGDEPDPAINPKFAHKLAFLDEMTHWTNAEGIAATDAILVGDLNIAPLEPTSGTIKLCCESSVTRRSR